MCYTCNTSYGRSSTNIVLCHGEDQMYTLYQLYMYIK
jgi:hypothetical protein